MVNDLIGRFVAVVAEAADALQSQASGPPRDWLLEYLAGDGDVINTDEAAYILARHRDTARSRAEKARGTDKPIGILICGSTWLFSQAHLLDSIEASSGLPARLEATTRAEEMRNLRHKTKLSTLLPT
jgi:hypothetical protein